MNLRYLVLHASVALALTSTLSAADVVRYEGQPSGSSVRMDGTSSIHDWYAQSALVSGSMEIDKDFKTDSVKPGKVNAKVESTIPVRTLKSSSGRPMDNVM